MAAQAQVEEPANRLDNLHIPEGSGWLGDIRADALARLQKQGLPTARDEYWKYTKPNRLTSQSAPAAALFDPQESPVFDAFDRLKLVFVDGVFAPELSDDTTLAGVEISRLAEAGQADIHWSKDVYGALEARGQNPVPRPLPDNHSSSNNFFFLKVSIGCQKPLCS